MARRFRCDQLFGDFIGKRRQQIVILDEKRQMDVIRNGVQCDNFDGKESPVFKEAAQARQGQRAGAQLGHERTVIDFFIPVRVNVFVKVIDECFGCAGFHCWFKCLESPRLGHDTYLYS